MGDFFGASFFDVLRKEINSFTEHLMEGNASEIALEMG